MKNIYMDYAAATPMDPLVFKAMQPYFSEKFYNPSATYLSARAVRNDLAEARSTVAQIIGARPAEIIFTAGATEANNLAIQGIMRQYPKGEILVSSVEHESVLNPAGLFKCRQIPVDRQGRVKLDELRRLINEHTVLVCVMLVNNELGTIQPLREISKILDKTSISRRQQRSPLPLYLHTDAAQAGNYLDLHASRLGVDLMSINGGKIYGPKQSGALYVKTGVQLSPLIVGGGQEFGLRSGTENVAGCIGLAAALKLAQQNRSEQAARITKLRIEFERRIIEKTPSASINGDSKHRAPHISNIRFNGVDNERLMIELDEIGIECAVGSACSASSEMPSHVLSAIGLKPVQARSSLRFSFGKSTTEKDTQTTLGKLVKLIEANR